jgi:Flp pilus assembly protein CpaB
MSRRARAVAFGAVALLCAALAAGLAGGYRSDVEAQLGPLRPVLVARDPIPARRTLRPVDAAKLVELRRVPERFAPRDALTSPDEMIGRAPIARIPAGAYVVAPELRAPRRPRSHSVSRLGGGRQPVDISVSGAEALAATGGDPVGSRVDVVVTTEPGPGGGPGRTRVAAKRVRLLDLSESGGASGSLDDVPGPGSAGWTATLALNRRQALRLIQAQNFAREVRLIPHGG